MTCWQLQHLDIGEGIAPDMVYDLFSGNATSLGEAGKVDLHMRGQSCPFSVAQN